MAAVLAALAQPLPRSGRSPLARVAQPRARSGRSPPLVAVVLRVTGNFPWLASWWQASGLGLVRTGYRFRLVAGFLDKGGVSKTVENLRFCWGPLWRSLPLQYLFAKSTFFSFQKHWKTLGFAGVRFGGPPFYSIFLMNLLSSLFKNHGKP